MIRRTRSEVGATVSMAVGSWRTDRALAISRGVAHYSGWVACAFRVYIYIYKIY